MNLNIQWNKKRKKLWIFWKFQNIFAEVLNKKFETVGLKFIKVNQNIGFSETFTIASNKNILSIQRVLIFYTKKKKKKKKKTPFLFKKKKKKKKTKKENK